MERNTEVQYDDDLTVGTDDYDESLYDGDIDLFEYVGEEESAITRLKTIIISIDWEITDNILHELYEELRELKDIWHGEKIYLVYVQALEKLSKYIYQERANANPNAIKLLLTFYTNLENIYLDEYLTDDEKKNILLKDVERFEKFKTQISQPKAKTTQVKSSPEPSSQNTPSTSDTQKQSQETSGLFGEKDDVLLNLKAIVFGIDWEITERDLVKLDQEVEILKQHFSSCKVRMLFLEGIGTLGKYVNAKRSDAHVDAFKLLHSFFAGLEKVVGESLTYDQEKTILLEEVSKFDVFKKEILTSTSSDEIVSPSRDNEYRQDKSPVVEDDDEDDDSTPAPALVAKAEENDISKEMDSRLDSFFGGGFDDFEAKNVDEDQLLQGVAVETEEDDDSEEEALPRHGDSLAPALSDEDYSFTEEVEPVASSIETVDTLTDPVQEFMEDHEQEPEPALGFLDDEAIPSNNDVDGSPGTEVEDHVDDFFAGEEIDPAFMGEREEDVSTISDESQTEISERLDGFFQETNGSPEAENGEFALQGVDVETEADDDSNEEPLNFQDGKVAPALSDDTPTQLESASGQLSNPEESADEIQDRLEDFFEDTLSSPGIEDDELALQGVDVETEADDDSNEEPLSLQDGKVAPALSDDTPTQLESASGQLSNPEESADEIQDRLEGFFEDTPSSSGIEDNELALQGVEVETEADDDSNEEPLRFEFEDDEVLPALGGAVEEIEAEALNGIDFHEEESDEISKVEQALLEEKEFIHEPLPGITGEEPKHRDDEIHDRLENFFEEKEEPIALEDTTAALLGVAVETEADDESKEEPLPLDGGEIAPALVMEEDESEMSEGALESVTDGEEYSVFDIDEEVEEDQTLLGSAIEETEVEDFSVEETLKHDIDEVKFHPDEIPEKEFDWETEISKEVAREDDFDRSEVVFEAVQDVEKDAEEVTFLPVDELDEQLFETESLTDNDLARDILKEEAQELEDFLTTDIPEIASTHDEEIGDELYDSLVETEKEEHLDPNLFVGESPESLIAIRNSLIDANGRVDSETLRKIQTDLDKLKQHWLDRPLEKTFLQLSATLVQHMERKPNQDNQEPSAHLLSIINKLEMISSGKFDQRQVGEALFEETNIVLAWQQKVIQGLQNDIDGSSDLLGVSGAQSTEHATGISTASEHAASEEEESRISNVLTQGLEDMRKVFKDEMDILRKELKEEISKPDA